MSRKILVILGHPSSTSLCSAISDSYVDGAERTEKEVRKILIGDLNFDPVLKNGYGEVQGLEADLIKAQELIVWADHLVFVYPNWWGSMPALLKGFFDRTFIPGFAFKYGEKSSQWDKLLSGKTAHLIVTMDTPALYYRWFYRMPGHNQMKRTILGFCGIKVTKITEFYSVKTAADKKIEEWLKESYEMGKRG